MSETIETPETVLRRQVGRLLQQICKKNGLKPFPQCTAGIQRAVVHEARAGVTRDYHLMMDILRRLKTPGDVPPETDVPRRPLPTVRLDT